MVITKDIKVPLYGGYLSILITNEEKTNPNDYYHDIAEGDCIEYAHAIFCNTKKNGKLTRTCLLAFNINNEYSKINNGTISHEAFHAVDIILSYIGLELSSDSGEAYSYLIAWVVDQVYKVFNKNNIDIHLKM